MIWEKSEIRVVLHCFPNMKIGVLDEDRLLEMYLSIETREKLMIFPAKYVYSYRFLPQFWDGMANMKWVDTIEVFQQEDIVFKRCG